MLNRLLCFVVFLTVQFGVINAEGQIYNYVAHTITGCVVDSATLKPLQRAVVLAVYGNNVKSTVTDSLGMFTLKFKESYLNMSLEISYLGYKMYKEKLIDVGWRVALGNIRMLPDPVSIDAIEVRGRLSMFRQRGDTLVIIPKGVGYKKGASLIDVLKDTHGVEIKDNTVKVGDDVIERAYVNGKLTFGKDPMNPLKYIDAAQTSAIEVYDEDNPGIQSNDSKHNKGKRKVFNILTFDGIAQSLQANVIGGFGYDLDKSVDGKADDRYLYGAGVRFFSEQRQLITDFVDNNINYLGGSLDDGAPFIGEADSRNQNLLVEYSDKLKGNWGVDFSYNMENNTSQQRIYREQIYFPTDEYSSRVFADTSVTNTTARKHNLKFKLENDEKKSNVFRINAELNLIDSQNDQLLSTQTTVDDKLVNRQRAIDYSKDDNYKIDLKTEYLRKMKFANLNVKASYSTSDNDMNGWRQDSSYVTATANEFLIKDSGRQTNSDVSIGLSGIKIKNAGEISLSYSLGYTYNKTNKIAYDPFSNSIDSTLTQNFTNNYIGNNICLGYGLSAGKKFSFGVSLAYDYKKFNRDEHFPMSYDAKDGFAALLPTASARYKINKTSNMSLTYITLPSAPSMEMLMNKLDNTNQLMLRGGNPNLKQAYKHNLMLGYNYFNPKTAVVYSISIMAGVTRNSIVNRTSFFADSTYLPQYNYTAIPGSSLITYGNADGEKFLRVSFMYSGSIDRWRYNLMAGYDYKTLPMYVRDKLLSSSRHKPNINISVTRIINEIFEMKLSSSTAYDFDKNQSGGKQKAINERASARFDLKIKRFFVRPEYEFVYYDNFDNANLRQIDHRLNASVGYSFFKDHNGEISLSAFDILNSNTGYSSMVDAESISSQWTQMSSRFMTLNFIYKFKSSK